MLRKFQQLVQIRKKLTPMTEISTTMAVAKIPKNKVNSTIITQPIVPYDATADSMDEFCKESRNNTTKKPTGIAIPDTVPAKRVSESRKTPRSSVTAPEVAISDWFA